MKRARAEMKQKGEQDIKDWNQEMDVWKGCVSVEPSHHTAEWVSRQMTLKIK